MIHKCGFTLLEILVTVVLLGILAVIIVPQLSRTSTDRYTFQPNDQLPAATAEISGVCPNRLGRVFKIQTQPGRRSL
jgi:prepilin-type N-terminal cleavage/methylation domain-containing protein